MLRVKASLKVYSKLYSLDEVKSIFSEDCDFGYSKGNNLYKSTDVYQESMWGKRSSREADATDLDAHLLDLLNWLSDRKSNYLKIIQGTPIKSDISVFMASDNGQGSASISSNILKMITEYDLDIFFDVYGSQEDDD